MALSFHKLENEKLLDKMKGVRQEQMVGRE